MSHMRTDYGNAERLIAQHGQDLRYCHPFKKWYCWDERCWRLDDSGGPVRAAKLTVRAIYAEAATAATEEDRKALAAWAVRSESNARIQAMLALAASETEAVVLPEELDYDPWLLNVANGVIDLHTGKLQPHDRDDLITKLAPVRYDPAAEAPTWVKFLDRIMAADEELIGFLQRAIGYSLTGVTGEECLFVPFGTGANGKSRFLGAVHALLGSYAQQLPRETLMAHNRSGAIPNDVAALAGVRFATAIETRKSQKLDEELVKQLTGGDKVRARFLFGEFFEFQPVAKMWLATNHKPRIVGTDDGIWRRIRVVPFTVTIPEGERDQHLAAKLEAELPGILRWAVDGCLAWQRHGLDPPGAVTGATAGYREEQDTLGEFIDQCCVVATDRYATPKELHDAYTQFTSERISQVELGKLLHERGFDSGKLKHRRVWFGIGVVEGTEADE